jgi:hypothetical protein
MTELPEPSNREGQPISKFYVWVPQQARFERSGAILRAPFQKGVRMAQKSSIFRQELAQESGSELRSKLIPESNWVAHLWHARIHLFDDGTAASPGSAVLLHAQLEPMAQTVKRSGRKLMVRVVYEAAALLVILKHGYRFFSAHVLNN